MIARRKCARAQERHSPQTTLKAKAVKTADAEGGALNRYHKLLSESGEAGRAH
jgi:hypothetical protein